MKPQDGIQYFVSGGAGKVRHGDILPDSAISASSYDLDHHFMLIELDEKEVAFKAIAKSGAVIDSGVIRQQE